MMLICNWPQNIESDSYSSSLRKFSSYENEKPDLHSSRSQSLLRKDQILDPVFHCLKLLQAWSSTN